MSYSTEKMFYGLYRNKNFSEKKTIYKILAYSTKKKIWLRYEFVNFQAAKNFIQKLRQRGCTKILFEKINPSFESKRKF